jgi:hypothetical protein
VARTKASGSGRSTQHPPEAPASEISQQPSRHVRVFHATADLNQAFDQVIAEVDRLKQLGLFHGEFPVRFAKTCRLSVEELRAWAIFEITEDLYQRADEDWARFGRMLRDWENKFKDPNDVLLEAERLKKKLAAKGAKKEPRKKNPKEGAK